MSSVFRSLAVVALFVTLGAQPHSANHQSPVPHSSVLLLTLDTVRADRMGFLGSARGLTPALDLFARQATVFTRAYAQAPVTTVSHATILTGTFPPFHRVTDFGAPLPAAVPYLPDLLRRNGYRTAAFVGSLVLDPRSGTAPGFERGFDRYDAGFRIRRPGEDRYQTLERRADDVVARAVRWIAAGGRGPWFAWVHLYDAHDPYDPPADLKRRFAAAPYDGEIAALDRAAGRLLQAAGDTALAVVTADHGEALGEHGEETHGVFLYDEVLRVPLAIRRPDRGGAGVRVDARVRLADVAPTLLEAIGIARPPTMQGETLLPLVNAQVRLKADTTTGRGSAADTATGRGSGADRATGRGSAVDTATGRGSAADTATGRGSAADTATGRGSAADTATGRGSAADTATGRGSAADTATGRGGAADTATGRGSAADTATGRGSAADTATGRGSAANTATGRGSAARTTTDNARGAVVSGFSRTVDAADRPAYAESDYPRHAFGWSMLASWRSDRFLLVRAPKPELYDLVADPGATKNLAAARARIVDGMTAELEQFVRRASGASDAARGRAPVDPALAERLAALGYVGGSGTTAAVPGIDPKDRIGIANALHIAVVAVEEGRFAAAVPLLERVVATEPGIAIAQLHLGVARARQRQFAPAIAPLTNAVSLQPDVMSAHYELGVALYETGDLARAAHEFEIVAARMPQWADARYSLGSVYARIDRVSQAQTELRAALDLEPRHVRANLLLGRILTLQNQAAAAIPFLRTATEVTPASAEAHEFLADAYDKVGNSSEAAKARERARSLRK